MGLWVLLAPPPVVTIQTLPKATNGRKGLFWLTVRGYGPARQPPSQWQGLGTASHVVPTAKEQSIECHLFIQTRMPPTMGTASYSSYSRQGDFLRLPGDSGFHQVDNGGQLRLTFTWAKVQASWDEQKVRFGMSEWIRHKSQAQHEGSASEPDSVCGNQAQHEGSASELDSVCGSQVQHEEGAV